MITRNRIKTVFCIAVVLGVTVTFSGNVLAGLINNGDFQTYKPGTGYTVTAALDGPGAFDTYAKGLGDGVPLLGGVQTATWGDGSGQSAPGGPVDLPGWVSVNGGDPDTGKNGVGGSNGLNIFAGWGGQQRVETDAAVGTVAAGSIYVITAQIDASAGMIAGGVAFDLVAAGTPLVPTSSTIPAGGAGFETISKTYDLTTLPGGVSAGDPLTIIVGVVDANAAGGRMPWDDVTLDVVPEPSTMLLAVIGLLSLVGYGWRRR